jgi:hypothetical protein
VYSLGVILFNALTKQLPYDLSGPRYDVLKRIQEAEPIRPSQIIPHFDAEVEAVLLKALAKKPNERYSSIAELGKDVHNWLEGLPVTARPATRLYLLKKFVARHRAVSAITVSLLTIIVSTSFISLHFYNQARHALKNSEAREDVYRKRADENLALARQVALDLFLASWHDGKIARARVTALHFADHSREKVAALFLLDDRPLAEKEQGYRDGLSAGQAHFWAVVLGEYHFKKRNVPKALEAYNQCLDASESFTEFDEWLRNRAKARLNELSKVNVPMRPPSNITGGE